jgi:hypothetical protein
MDPNINDSISSEEDFKAAAKVHQGRRKLSIFEHLTKDPHENNDTKIFFQLNDSGNYVI